MTTPRHALVVLVVAVASAPPPPPPGRAWQAEAAVDPSLHDRVLLYEAGRNPGELGEEADGGDEWTAKIAVGGMSPRSWLG